MKVTIDNIKMNEHDCVPIKLYLIEQVADQIWPVDCTLPTLELHYATEGECKK